MHEMLECASMHSRTLNASTIISPQMHFHYWQTDTSPFAMYFGSIEIYFGANEKEIKKQKLVVHGLQRQNIGMNFRVYRQQYNGSWIYGAVECCRSLDVSKCDSKPIHTIFNDFDSNKCDLKKKKIGERTKISFSLILVCCLSDGLELFLLESLTLSVHTSI